MPESEFRVAFAPGVIVDKWTRIWADRMPGTRLDCAPVDDADLVPAVLDGRFSMAFVRLPVERDGLHLIPLYEEVPVVVAAKEHPIAAFDEVPLADLAHEHLLQDPDSVPEWNDIASEVAQGTRTPVPDLTIAQAIETAAAGTGIVIVPMSIARLFHRKDVVHRRVLGVAESQVGLVWRSDDANPLIEAFVGIVRGRSERSSRGATEPSAPSDKTAPKQERARPARARRRAGEGRRGRPPQGRRRS